MFTSLLAAPETYSDLTPALPELPGRSSGCYWPFSLSLSLGRLGGGGCQVLLRTSRPWPCTLFRHAFQGVGKHARVARLQSWSTGRRTSCSWLLLARPVPAGAVLVGTPARQQHAGRWPARHAPARSQLTAAAACAGASRAAPSPQLRWHMCAGRCSTVGSGVVLRCRLEGPSSPILRGTCTPRRSRGRQGHGHAPRTFSIDLPRIFGAGLRAQDCLQPPGRAPLPAASVWLSQQRRSVHVARIRAPGGRTALHRVPWVRQSSWRPSQARTVQPWPSRAGGRHGRNDPSSQRPVDGGPTAPVGGTSAPVYCHPWGSPTRNPGAAGAAPNDPVIGVPRHRRAAGVRWGSGTGPHRSGDPHCMGSNPSA